MNSICLVCHNPDDRFLCSTCWNELAVELADLGGYQRNANGERMIPMAVELEIVLSRQDRLGKVTVQVSGTTERPLPVNLHAGRIRDRLHGILAGWVARVSFADYRPSATMVENAQWLLAREHDVRGLHDVDELFASITEAIAAARKVIDNRSVRIFVGVCGAEIEADGDDPAWTCTAALWADSAYAMTRCQFCDTSWPSMDRWQGYLADDRRRRLDEVPGKHLGPRRMARTLAALGIEIDESTIRSWARKGLIASTGTDQQGHKTYLTGDVMALIPGDTPEDQPAELIESA